VIHDFASAPPRGVRLEWRVSFFRDSWQRSPKARLFAREHDALRFLKRLELASYEVLIEWREVKPWRWSDAEDIEHRLGPTTVRRLEGEAARAHRRRLERAQRRAAIAEPLPDPRVSEGD
jgi:hypothetical protein